MIGHEQDQLGEHSDAQQDQIHNADKGHAGLDQISQLDLGQGHAAVQHIADRGSGQTNAQVGDHDNTEVNGIQAKAFGDRQQNRSQDHDSRAGVHDAADQDEQQIYQQHEGHRTAGHGENDLSQQLGNRAGGDHVSGYLSRTDNKHHDSGGLHGVDHQVGPLFKLEFTIHKARDDQCVQNSQSGSFGSGGNAGGDAQDDKYGKADRKESFFGGPENAGQAGLGANRIVALTDMEKPCEHQADSDQNAGDDAAQEQSGNGDLGADAVEDHLGGRGNDGANAAGGADDAGGFALIIASAVHDRKHHGTDCGGVSHCGAGHACEDHGSQNAHVTQTTLEAAQHGVSKINDTTGNAAAGHDLTGDHKEGDGQQRHAVSAVDKFLGHREKGPCRGTAQGLGKHHEEAGAHQRERDGNANDNQAEKGDQKYS
ncbi:hypothetical protein SDC9_76797 [bioreactor metagenome]|uniref:Uncharacterized protein n=1 Tax=bioreactor metagenome TaxID=1076179 RepID=A0A644YPK7_9ZZZZ